MAKESSEQTKKKINTRKSMEESEHRRNEGKEKEKSHDFNIKTDESLIFEPLKTDDSMNIHAQFSICFH